MPPAADDDIKARFDSRPLDPEEIRSLRAMHEEWERYKWFLKLSQRIAAWTAGVTAFVWASREHIARAMKAIFH